MGVIVRRCTYGISTKDAKQQLIASIARFNHVLRGSSEISLNLGTKKPLKILIITSGGASRHKESDTIDDALFKQLVDAKSFEIEIKLFTAWRGSKSRIMIWYDEKHHMRNSIGIEFIGDYLEGVSFMLLGLIGILNSAKAAALQRPTVSVLNRLQNLWEDVFKSYSGNAMTKSEQEFNLRKYEMDSIVINIFGNLIKLRKN